MHPNVVEARAIALEHQILEAIDQLRNRKARPDADRICNFMLRKYSVDARDTIADLHRLIEVEKVIQVDYKGHTSYRNAAKWTRLQLYKNRPEGFIKDKLNSGMISTAVSELVVGEPDYLDQGVPSGRLIEQLLDGKSSPTSRRMVEDFLNKEVACGNLTRLSNGNYSLVATSDVSTPEAPDTPGPDSATSSAAAANATTPVSRGSQQNGNSSAQRVGKRAASKTGGSCSSSRSSSRSSNGSGAVVKRRKKTTMATTTTTAATTAAAAVTAVAAAATTTTATTTTSSSSFTTATTTLAITATATMTASTTTTTNTTATITTTALSAASTATITTAAATAAKTLAAAAAELYEFDETDNLTTTDSGSNTPRLSRQTSPKMMDQPDSKKSVSECVEIVVDKSDSVVNSSDVSLPQVIECDDNQEPAAPTEVDVPAHVAPAPVVVEESPKCNDQITPNLKRPTKAERKQRLFARTEDPMDMKFEDDPRDSKEELEALKDKRDETDRRSSDDREDEEAGRSSTNTSPTPSNVNASGFRSARRKRAKKVFDPSDNNLVKRKRGRQPGSHNKNSLTQDSQDIAKVLIKDGPCRQCSLCAKEKQEALVACRDCTVRAHPSCIYSPEEMLQKANSNWQCERCKSCTICCETSDAGPLVTCFSCDEAYHYYCHTPRVTTPKSNSKWHCNDCLQKQYKTNAERQNVNAINTSGPDSPSNQPGGVMFSSTPPVLSPQVSPARISDQMEDDTPKDKIDPNIPDASDWTSEQVYQYFARLFPKEAEVFRNQEIDGHSLLLLKRSDVLTGLDLLLGPALKIYRHVLKLQVRRDDPKLYWL